VKREADSSVISFAFDLRTQVPRGFGVAPLLTRLRVHMTNVDAQFEVPMPLHELLEFF
jgi:hypothetical protein